MPKKKYTPEVIIRMLREAEVEVGQGLGVAAACKKLGVTPNTFYHWREEYGGLKVNQAKRLNDLERENGRLKKIVDDQQLDMSILREAASPYF